jgi:hypothetical protein
MGIRLIPFLFLLFPLINLQSLNRNIKVVDEFGGKGNVLNFNVGEGVKFALPNVFWTRLTSKYGTVSNYIVWELIPSFVNSIIYLRAHL